MLPNHVLYLSCMATGEDQLPHKRTKVVPRFGKVVAKAESVITIDEHAGFSVDKLVDTEESG